MKHLFGAAIQVSAKAALATAAVAAVVALEHRSRSASSVAEPEEGCRKIPGKRRVPTRRRKKTVDAEVVEDLVGKVLDERFGTPLTENGRLPSERVSAPDDEARGGG